MQVPAAENARSLTERAQRHDHSVVHTFTVFITASASVRVL